MYSSSSAVLLLQIPQTPKVVPDWRVAKISKRRGAGGHDLFCDGSLIVLIRSANENSFCYIVDLPIFVLALLCIHRTIEISQIIFSSKILKFSSKILSDRVPVL